MGLNKAVGDKAKTNLAEAKAEEPTFMERVRRMARKGAIAAVAVPFLLVGSQTIAPTSLLRAQDQPQVQTQEERVWKPSIDNNTPYTYVNGIAMYDLGRMPKIDQSVKTASPCEAKDPSATYADGIYSCPPKPLAKSEDAEEKLQVYHDATDIAADMTPTFAGYVSFSSTSTFNTVQGTWIVQPVEVNDERRPELSMGRLPIQTNKQTAYSAQWVGIEGGADSTLIQTGTQSNIVNGVAGYCPWYELIPQSAIAIDSFQISPGDIMIGKISAVQNEANTWEISLIDVTSGQGFKLTVSYKTEATSAGWLMERPQMCSNNICATSNPLPGIATIFSGEDYVSVPSGMSMPSDYADNGNGLEPVGQLPNLTRFVMTANGNDNELIAVPTPLTNDGTSFTIVKSIRRYVLTD
jgi:hypothetical protein